MRLCAADEPLEESFGTIVLRHVNIGIARGYHHELMVKSRQGLETSTRQGWHTGGVALYGYRFAVHDHPNPHKASRGQAKRTLDLDPVRAPVVRAIYEMYLAGGVGITQIRDRLNAEPDRYPPPVPVDPARSLGAWSRSSVWEVLRNPKYTGYQVWNRKARKKGHNRVNPEQTWIWSEEPAHPAIVTKDEHAAVAARAAANHRSRQQGADGGQSAESTGGSAPRARTDYLYRGLLRCGICELRMWGKHRRNLRYYSCQPSHQRTKAAIPEDHPSTTYLPEPALTTAVCGFLGQALFGPERESYWQARIADATEEAPAAPAAQRLAEINTEIADLERRLSRQIANLEADDTTAALRRRIAERVGELEAAIADRRARVERLAAEMAEAPPTPAEMASLVERLPLIAEHLDQLPRERLRALYDSLQLAVTYQPATKTADLEVTVVVDENSDQNRETSQVWSVGEGRGGMGMRREGRSGTGEGGEVRVGAPPRGGGEQPSRRK